MLLRQAPAPAEQAHICESLVPCGNHDRVVLVVVVLAWSHAVWAEFCVDAEDQLCEALGHAWGFFGGAPRTWLFETEAAVAPRVLELARRHGATARPFMEHDGVRWGEWALRCVPERLLRPHLLRDPWMANRALRVFVEEMLLRDRLGQPKCRVHDLLVQERQNLRPADMP